MTSDEVETLQMSGESWGERDKLKTRQGGRGDQEPGLQEHRGLGGQVEGWRPLKETESVELQ